MAITNTCLRFFLYGKKQGVSFHKTITLGRLENKVSGNLPTHLKSLFPGMINPEYINFEEKFGESVFRSLGAESVESLDFSNYEKAGIIGDLNYPLPAEMFNKYSVLVDGGTLEHVFNFPQAIKNCMNLIEPGGHFIGFSPANNLMGHGFYQFSPELFYRVFSKENGFGNTEVFMISAEFETDTTELYAVSDPEMVRSRVTLKSTQPGYLLVLSRKLHQTSLGPFTVYQSDYVDLWKKPENNETIIKSISLMKIIKNKVSQLLKWKTRPENLERQSPEFFKKKTF
jgi:hypothetical protein